MESSSVQQTLMFIVISMNIFRDTSVAGNFRGDLSVQGLLKQDPVVLASHGHPIYSVRKDSETVIKMLIATHFGTVWPNAWQRILLERIK